MGKPRGERINIESVLVAPIMFVLGAGAAIAGIIVAGWELLAGDPGSPMAGGVIALGFGAPIAFLGWKHWRHGASHLLVDTSAGVVRLVSGKQAKSCPLHSFGLQPVEKYEHRNSYGRYMQDRYRVVAQGLSLLLIDTASESAARRLHSRVEQAIARRIPEIGNS